MKEEKFKKHMKTTLVFNGVAIGIAIIVIFLIKKFHILGDKATLLTLLVLLFTVAVISYFVERRGKKYWQNEYLNNLSILYKINEIWLIIAFAFIILTFAIPDKTYIDKFDDIFIILILLSKYGFEIYKYMFAKKYNMWSYESREDFEEKHKNII